MDREDESLYAASELHDQWPSRPYMIKSFKIVFFGTKGPVALGLAMLHCKHEPTKV